MKKTEQNTFETTHFPSTDGLRITADVYSAEHVKGFILLCH